MTEHDLVRMIVRIFDKLSIPYFVTGGMAAIAYGEPRYTSDVDVVADISLESATMFNNLSIHAFSREPFLPGGVSEGQKFGNITIFHVSHRKEADMRWLDNTPLRFTNRPRGWSAAAQIP